MEITVPLELSREEESLVDMHSLLNILNVVSRELLEIGELLDAPEEVVVLIDDVVEAAAALRDPQRARGLIAGIEQFISNVDPIQVRGHNRRNPVAPACDDADKERNVLR